MGSICDKSKNYTCILDFSNSIKFLECDEFLHGSIKAVNSKVFLQWKCRWQQQMRQSKWNNKLGSLSLKKRWEMSTSESHMVRKQNTNVMF